MLQRHYPERLRCLYFLRAPLLFWGVWRLLASFVDPVTREKIQFVGSGEAGRQALLRAVPEQVRRGEVRGGGSQPCSEGCRWSGPELVGRDIVAMPSVERALPASPSQVLPEAYGGSAPFIPVLEGLSLFALPTPPPPSALASPAGAVERRGPLHGLAALASHLPGVAWVGRQWTARRRGIGPRAQAPPSPHLHVHHHHHHHHGPGRRRHPAHQLARDTWQRAGSLSRSMRRLLSAAPGEEASSWLLLGKRPPRAGAGAAAAAQWALAAVVVLVLMRLALMCAAVLAPQLADWRAAAAALLPAR